MILKVSVYDTTPEIPQR